MAKEIAQFDETTGRRIAYTEVKLREQKERRETREQRRRFLIDLDDVVFDREHRRRQCDVRSLRIIKYFKKCPDDALNALKCHSRHDVLFMTLTTLTIPNHKRQIVNIIKDLERSSTVLMAQT